MKVKDEKLTVIRNIPLLPLYKNVVLWKREYNRE